MDIQHFGVLSIRQKQRNLNCQIRLHNFWDAALGETDLTSGWGQKNMTVTHYSRRVLDLKFPE